MSHRKGFVPSAVLNSQSLAHTSASSISGISELLRSPRILSPKLKADSDETVLRGIARKSGTIVDNTGNLSDLLFHHVRISKSSLSPSSGSSKYVSISDFRACATRSRVVYWANSTSSFLFPRTGNHTLVESSFLRGIITTLPLSLSNTQPISSNLHTNYKSKATWPEYYLFQ